MPKFQSILQSEIKEKSPGDIVTVVDHAVEKALNVRLPAVLRGSRVIGEEAVAATPKLIDSLNDGVVWLVDPLDGTRNFVNGSSDFAIMIALLKNGVTINSWIYSPVHKTLAFAEKGNGTYWNGERVKSGAFEKSTPLKGFVHTRFLPATWPETIRQRATGVAELIPPCGSAGATYPQLLEERINFIIYWRTLAWDHVPGALIVTEAGGSVTRFDGSPYNAADMTKGLLVAVNQEVAETIQNFLPK